MILLLSCPFYVLRWQTIERNIGMRLKTRSVAQATAALSADPVESAHRLLGTAQHVERWKGREQFVVLDTAFDFGEKFLLAWQAWRVDDSRPKRLHYIAIDESPYQAEALRVAHEKWPELAALSGELRQCWPIALPGMHRILLSDRAVTLTLVFGQLEKNLPQIDAEIDSFLFDPKSEHLCSSGPVCTWLARLAQPQAVLARAAPTHAGEEALRKAGFVCDVSSARAEFKPRRNRPAVHPRDDRSAIVIGAGLAGTAMCQRLCARGWEVSLIEQHAGEAQEASGNRAGVFMPMLTKDDSSGARLSRAAFLFALRLWRDIGGIGVAFDGAANGVLLLARDEEHADSAAAIAARADLPRAFARYLNADDVVSLVPALSAAMNVAAGAWLFEQGGWAHPGGLCAALLSACGAQLHRMHNRVAAQLIRVGDQWHVLDQHALPIAQATHVIIANGVAARQFVQTSGLPLAAIRGQVTYVAADLLPDLPMPVCGDGYVIPARDGLCSIGATYDADRDTRLRADSQHENLARLASLFPNQAMQINNLPLLGRAGLRCVSPDRLPLVGCVPDDDAIKVMRGERLRDVPRHADLHCLLAYASRGLIWAPLMAELMAARICREPLPLERDVCATIDPARFALQAHRRGKNKS